MDFTTPQLVNKIWSCNFLDHLCGRATHVRRTLPLYVQNKPYIDEFSIIYADAHMRTIPKARGYESWQLAVQVLILRDRGVLVIYI